MKIGIIGSREYQNFRKVKDTIFALKNKFGDNLTIVSGGCKDGADKFAKKYAIELGCNYLEFNPAMEALTPLKRQKNAKKKL